MNNNKNIYNNNNEVCINNVHTYLLKIITNNNYSTVIYLMYTKNFTYRYELNNLISYNNWKYYFSKLLKNNIIQEYNLNIDEQCFLVRKDKTGRYHIDNSIYYTLTTKARELLDTKKYNDLMMDFISKETQDYILDYKAKFKVLIERLNRRSEEKELQELTHDAIYDVLSCGGELKNG